jgi:hypothetical protein
VIQALKTHLRQEYSWYSEKEIEQMVYKFLNEYLAKLSLLTSSSKEEAETPLLQMGGVSSTGVNHPTAQKMSMGGGQ